MAVMSQSKVLAYLYKVKYLYVCNNVTTDYWPLESVSS